MILPRMIWKDKSRTKSFLQVTLEEFSQKKLFENLEVGKILRIK